MLQVGRPETGASRSLAWSGPAGEAWAWGAVCHSPLAERKQGDAARSLRPGPFHVRGTR